ncbi:MAG: hypothetical protein IPO83_01835 [Chitinophagaceae bacterium]|nr:hypothetical protein [Chitinophagaceae bacterium]
MDPETEFCISLATKTGIQVQDLQNKIHQTVKLLTTTYDRSSKKGKLNIYYLKNYPTQTIFLTEDKIVVTPYQVASGQNVIPLFEYDYNENKKSIGYHISTDIDNVRIESKIIEQRGSN